jgi:cell division protease FtsH
VSDNKEYSEKVSALIDSEVFDIMTIARTKAEEIIRTNKQALDAVAERLIEVETIERDEYEKIIIAHGIPLKKKQDIEHQA